MKDSLECAGCGHEFSIYSWDSEAYGCPLCFSILHRKGQLWVKAKSTQPIVSTPLLEIGKTAVLKGFEVTVIAYLVRRDKASGFLWREYCLQTQNGALRWLAEVDGHWTLLAETTREPTRTKSAYSNTGSMKYNGRVYELFQQGSAHVVAVLGEFSWPIVTDERVSLTEYVCPPYLLSVERANSEETWFDGFYVEAGEVRKAFGLRRMPPQEGIAPNQPAALTGNTSRLAWMTVIAAALMFCIQLAFVATSTNESIFSHRLTYSPLVVSQAETTPAFTIPPGTANVELELIADLQNSWVNMDFVLTNEATGESFGSDIDLEYYSGSDVDGSWTEGDTRGTRTISSVPGGQYRLVLNTDGIKSTGAPIAMDIRLKRDVPLFGNMFVGMLLVLSLPLFLFWRHGEFNNKRWGNR